MRSGLVSIVGALSGNRESSDRKARLSGLNCAGRVEKTGQGEHIRRRKKYQPEQIVNLL